MPTGRAIWLPLAAVMSNGLLAGASLDQSIKQLPAPPPHRRDHSCRRLCAATRGGESGSPVVDRPAAAAALRRLGAAADGGLVLLAAGVVVLVQAFVRFVLEGVGTPAPIAPTQQLVVSGPTGMSATPCTWRSPR